MQIGRLYSYGNLPASGGTRLKFSESTPISPIKTGWPRGFHPLFVSPLVAVGRPYPYDTAGITGGAEFQEPVVLVYSYVILAPYADTDAQAFQYLRTQYNTVWNFFTSTYTLDSVTGASGQRGWLVVQDEDESTGHLYKAKVRAMSAGEFDLIVGEPHRMELTLSFALLEDFVLIA